MLQVGTRAPDVQFRFHDGSQSRLSDYYGRHHVVLYFYPKDFTWGCTREACRFADVHPDLQSYDAILIGISADPPEQHKRFARAHNLPFLLVTDERNVLASTYDVLVLGGLRRLRVTYVIDKEGTIRGVLHHELFVKRHATRALAILHMLKT
ncbi:MAG: peroxiredoxin [Bacteroidia bacterium]|nr:MAG: peroxiredoxin [Bacteroidia bacterium]